MSDRQRASERDRGASLLVAIGFVMMIGAITAGLSSLVISSVNNRATLTTVRNRQYAADAAVEVAIAQVRSQFDGRVSCTAATGSTSTTTNQLAIRVQWTSACIAVRTADDAADVVLELLSLDREDGTVGSLPVDAPTASVLVSCLRV